MTLALGCKPQTTKARWTVHSMEKFGNWKPRYHKTQILTFKHFQKLCKF